MAIIAKKCCSEIWTNFVGGADVLRPALVVGLEGVMGLQVLKLMAWVKEDELATLGYESPKQG